MDVRLSPEQHALRDAAAQVVDRLGVRAVGELDDAERVAKLDAAVGASGWRELRTSADEGTPGAGGAPLASGIEVALVAEELGRRLADTAFLGPTLAAELRRLAGAPPATAPETVVLRSDLAELAVTVDGSVPPGTVAVDVPWVPVPDRGPSASGWSAALILVRNGAGQGHDDVRYTLGRVELTTGTADEILRINAAVERRPIDGGPPQAEAWCDLTRRVVALGRAPAVTPVAGQTPSLTRAEVTATTALGLATACADLVGTMRGALRLATDYAMDRRQYGVAIGSFQAVQHLLADAMVATEGSYSVALHAAWAVDALPPDEALVAAAGAKAYCARAARSVCETAIQVHGGIGNTWECLAHVFLRRALLSSDVFGGVGRSLDRVLDHRGIGGS